MPTAFEQKSTPAKKEKKEKEPKKKEKEVAKEKDVDAPPPEKKAPNPLAVLDKDAKSPFSGDAWKKVRLVVENISIAS